MKKSCKVAELQSSRGRSLFNYPLSIILISVALPISV